VDLSRRGVWINPHFLAYRFPQYYIPVHLPSLGIHMGASRISAAKNTNMCKYPNMGSHCTEAIAFYGTEPNNTKQKLKNSHGS
jgi:hypothetical protein